jgi:hypothetical protein
MPIGKDIANERPARRFYDRGSRPLPQSPPRTHPTREIATTPCLGAPAAAARPVVTPRGGRHPFLPAAAAGASRRGGERGLVGCCRRGGGRVNGAADAGRIWSFHGTPDACGLLLLLWLGRRLGGRVWGFSFSVELELARRLAFVRVSSGGTHTLRRGRRFSSEEEVSRLRLSGGRAQRPSHKTRAHCRPRVDGASLPSWGARRGHHHHSISTSKVR